MYNEDFERINKLALDILRLSRNTLLVNLRFLDMALGQLQFVSTELPCLATDGEYLIYNPVYLLKSYKNEKEAPVRDYLHIIMHCIFRHMFLNPTIKRNYWDLACDIAVENAINELYIKSVESDRANAQKNYIAKIKQELKFLTAEKIYFYLIENENEEQLEAIRQLFYADNHEIWYMTSEQANKKYSLKSDSNSDKKNSNQDDQNSQNNCDDNNNADSDADADANANANANADSNSNDTKDQESQNSKNDDSKNESNDQSQQSQNGGEDSDSSSKDQDDSLGSVRKELENRWKDISERIQTDLETFSKQQGNNAGGFIQNLKSVNREKYDYTSFLKKFAVLGEAMKINDDEFDYVFYTYGLKLYKKMPLIEPLEYKEVKRIKEFVIAIDTSGSVKGDKVQAFIQKTYNILKSTESFFSKINLHIIQCDAEIQEDVKITSQEDFDKYLKTMRIKGFGGTNFVPVFDYVDKLQREKEFTNLKGLIYFTDGFGTFPLKKPAYNTAFVFIDDEYNNPDVPPWAIKLVLQKNEI